MHHPKRRTCERFHEAGCGNSKAKFKSNTKAQTPYVIIEVALVRRIQKTKETEIMNKGNYSHEFKEAVQKRMLPPEKATIAQLAEEYRIRKSTLRYW